MTYLLGALIALAFLALLAFVAWFVRDVRGEQRATRIHITLTARALAEQLNRHHEEQRRHIADAAIVVQLAAKDATRRPRFIPPVEVRPAPPLRARPEEVTPLAGTPRPMGAA